MKFWINDIYLWALKYKKDLAKKQFVLVNSPVIGPYIGSPGSLSVQEIIENEKLD